MTWLFLFCFVVVLCLPKPIDISGMRFNNLVAIEKAPSRSGHTYWKFRCDCGVEKEIMKCHVINESIKSCGCISLTHDPTPRTCPICEQEFFGLLGDTQVFCYDCSPRGLSVADAHRSQKRALKHILVEYKGGECVECGYKKCEGALQFHHIDAKDKDFTLSLVKPGQIDLDALKIEADKCILLCANCHIKKHEITDLVAIIMRLPSNDSKNYGIKTCKVCNDEFIANYPNRNYCYSCSPAGATIKDAMRMKKRAIKHELLQYKGGAKCISCGYDEYEGSLQLHHRNPEEKEFTFSKTPINDTDFNMDKMRNEADKCDVLCANCHFEVHYKNDDDIED